MSLLRRVVRRLKSWVNTLRAGRRQLRPFDSVFLDELPTSLRPGTLYVCGEGEHLWSVSFLCPCGCEDAVHLSLHRDGRPRWELSEHDDGSLSLRPSVWRRTGCRSHFVIERGIIRWCRESPRSSPTHLAIPTTPRDRPS